MSLGRALIPSSPHVLWWWHRGDITHVHLPFNATSPCRVWTAAPPLPFIRAVPATTSATCSLYARTHATASEQRTVRVDCTNITRYADRIPLTLFRLAHWFRCWLSFASFAALPAYTYRSAVCCSAYHRHFSHCSVVHATSRFEQLPAGCLSPAVPTHRYSCRLFTAYLQLHITYTTTQTIRLLLTRFSSRRIACNASPVTVEGIAHLPTEKQGRFLSVQRQRRPY